MLSSNSNLYNRYVALNGLPNNFRLRLLTVRRHNKRIINFHASEEELEETDLILDHPGHPKLLEKAFDLEQPSMEVLEPEVAKKKKSKKANEPSFIF